MVRSEGIPWPGKRGALLLMCECCRAVCRVGALWEHVEALVVPEPQHGLAGSGFGGPNP